jgi:hypothetical protein
MGEWWRWLIVGDEWVVFMMVGRVVLVVVVCVCVCVCGGGGAVIVGGIE